MIMMLIRFATWQDCTYLVHLVIKIADFYLRSVGLECIVKGKQFVSTKPTGRWVPVGFPYRPCQAPGCHDFVCGLVDMLPRT